MNDDLADRLDAVESDLADAPTAGGSGIVYTDGDGYVTPDGDPVPTTDGGDPVVPGATGPVIVLLGEYDPREHADTDR